MAGKRDHGKAAEKKERRKHVREFTCLLCESEEKPTFADAVAFVAHCREAHPETVNAEGKVTGRKAGVQFLDGSDWYSNTFRWETNDGKAMAMEVNSGPRGRYDPMNDE